MFHDRVSFGGSLIAIGVLYLWLLMFPLQQGESWAWWVFVVSGVTGFGSFLAYLGYGYLDTWHGSATLLLIIPYLWGLARTRRRLKPTGTFRTLLQLSTFFRGDLPSFGRLCWVATGAGMLLGGMVILIVGMTEVFVPQDLSFMGLDAARLNAINPRLIPLIAHDRAGFGGGVGTAGLVLLCCVWCGRPSRALWEAVTAAGAVGFACAIGIHPLIGYTSFSHLLPAYAGLILFLTGTVLSYPRRQS
jgi:hypothetical protein